MTGDSAIEGSAELTVVVDTNVILQGKPLADMPWEQFAPQVEVLLIDPVLTELDRWKGEGNDRRAKRVRAMLPQLRQLLSSEGLSILLKEKPVRARLSMRPASAVAQADDPDGAIVDIVHDLTVSGCNAMLLTRDVIMALRARRRGVRYRLLSPDDADWNANNERSSADQEELQRRLREYEDQRPEMKLTIIGHGVSSEQTSLTVLCPKPDQLGKVGPFLFEWAERYYASPLEKRRDLKSVPWQDDLAQIEYRFTSKLIKRLLSGPRVELQVHNDGTVNANDVLVEIITEGPWLLRMNLNELAVDIPHAPEQQKPANYGRFELPTYTRFIPDVEFPFDRDDGWHWERYEEDPVKGTRHLAARIPQLLHRGRLSLPFHIGVEHPAVAPGKLIVRISSAGQPKVATTIYTLNREAPSWSLDELVQTLLENKELVIGIKEK